MGSKMNFPEITNTMPKDAYNLESLTEIDLPVRCFTCNKVIGNKFYQWIAEEKRIEQEDVDLGEKTKNLVIMENIGLKNDCCRSLVWSHVEYQKKK
jgi:DNA-directed RNA polymerase subunit N